MGGPSPSRTWSGIRTRGDRARGARTPRPHERVLLHVWSDDEDPRRQDPSAMTFVDATRTSSRSLGNFNRLVQAKDVVASGQRGVDFSECISEAAPFSITSASPIAIKPTPREDPA